MLFHTPWGAPQHQESVAPGVTRVSTAGHGGYHVDASAVATMRPALAAFATFAGGDGCGGRWFEEDEDWCVVALAFPHLFNPYQVWCALQTFGCCARTQPRFAAADRGFTGLPRDDAERIAAAWYEEHRDHWQIQSYSCGTAAGWIVHYRHLSRGEVACRLVPGDEFRRLGSVVATLPGEPYARAPRPVPTATVA